MKNKYNEMLRFGLLISALIFFAQCTKKITTGQSSNGDCICMEIYQPVCGKDGKEYSNSCYADCANVKYKEGPCPIEGTGKVMYLGDPKVDGCGWVIASMKDGKILNLRANKLEEKYKEQGVSVKITYKPTLEKSPCGRGSQIPIIDIVKIQKN